MSAEEEEMVDHVKDDDDNEEDYSLEAHEDQLKKVKREQFILDTCDRYYDIANNRKILEEDGKMTHIDVLKGQLLANGEFPES